MDSTAYQNDEGGYGTLRARWCTTLARPGTTVCPGFDVGGCEDQLDFCGTPALGWAFCDPPPREL